MMTIKTKIILLVSLVVGLLFTGFGVFIYHQVHNANLDKIDARLVSLSQQMRDELDEQIEKKRFPDNADLKRLLSENLSKSCMRLYDSSGSIVYADSMFRSETNTLEPKTVGAKPIVQTVKLHGHHYRSLIRTVEIEDNPRWLLQIAAPLSEVEANLNQLRILLWTTIPIALLLSAFLVNLIVRRAFRPLSAMIETANRVSASTLHERLMLPKGRDEVVLLGIALNRMVERLEAAFKSQKQFIVDASHELRTPLTIVQSELEFANRSLLPDAAKQSISIALDELDHLRKLANDLLMLVKLEVAGQVVECSAVRVDELITDCVQKISRIASEKQVALHLEIAEAVEMVGDEDKLRSAFMNVLENALKYTQGGGSVSVRLTTQKGSVVIALQDNGIGISPTDLPHIFKPFYRSAASRAQNAGSGLGLSIAQRIVELHGGTITVQSDGASGSTFTIQLPMARTES
ncbi:MAG: HAMP domain-containing sensor histidine kinase [bacterium]